MVPSEAEQPEQRGILHQPQSILGAARGAKAIYAVRSFRCGYEWMAVLFKKRFVRLRRCSDASIQNLETAMACVYTLP